MDGSSQVGVVMCSVRDESNDGIEAGIETYAHTRRGRGCFSATTKEGAPPPA